MVAETVFDVLQHQARRAYLDATYGQVSPEEKERLMAEYLRIEAEMDALLEGEK